MQILQPIPQAEIILNPINLCSFTICELASLSQLPLEQAQWILADGGQRDRRVRNDLSQQALWLEVPPFRHLASNGPPPEVILQSPQQIPTPSEYPAWQGPFLCKGKC